MRSTQAGWPGPFFPYSANRIGWFGTRAGENASWLSVASNRVSQFINQDGGEVLAQAGVTERATWEADSVAGSMNGLPSAHGDGGDFYWGSGATILAPFKNNTAKTIYLVAAPDVAAANQAVLSFANSAASLGYYAYGWESTGKMWANVNGNSAPNGVGATTCNNGQPYVLAFRQTGALVKGWLNALVDMAETAQNPGTLAAINRWGILARARSTNDLKFTGKIGEGLVYSAAHTDYEVQCQSAWLFERWQLGHNMVVTMGDSLSRGFGSASGEFLSDRLSLASNNGKWTRYNGATNGYTTADVLSVFAARVTVRRRWVAARDVMHLWIGTNDITTTTDSAATIYGRITTIIAQAKALGYRVVVNTIINRSDSRMSGDGVTPANTIAASLRPLILANAAGADAVYDAYNELNVIAGAEANTAPNFYYSDDTHLTDAGYQLLSLGQAATINSVA